MERNRAGRERKLTRRHPQSGMQDNKLVFRDAENMTRSEFKAFTARDVREARAMDRRMEAVEGEIEASGTIFVRKHHKTPLQQPRE